MIGISHHHGIVSSSQRVNVPVALPGPSSATRTASRAPSSTAGELTSIRDCRVLDEYVETAELALDAFRRGGD
jgi:hypothetical protein